MSSKHYYNTRGTLVSPHTPKALPSVTTILDVINKPGLNEWRLRVGAAAAYKKMSESAQRGTTIHALVSDWINNKTVEPENEDHEAMLTGYINFQDKFSPSKLQSEVFLVSKLYGYAGTADIICEIDGEPWLLDLKTSKQINPSFGLQLRAYEQMLFEKTGKHARMGVIQLTDTVKAGYRFKEMDAPIEVFLGAKEIFDWQKQFDKSPKFANGIMYK